MGPRRQSHRGTGSREKTSYWGSGSEGRPESARRDSRGNDFLAASGRRHHTHMLHNASCTISLPRAPLPRQVWALEGQAPLSAPVSTGRHTGLTWGQDNNMCLYFIYQIATKSTHRNPVGTGLPVLISQTTVNTRKAVGLPHPATITRRAWWGLEQCRPSLEPLLGG